MMEPYQINLKISVDVEVQTFENRTGISLVDLSKQVYEAVEEERKALATEVRIAAIRLLTGDLLE